MSDFSTVNENYNILELVDMVGGKNADYIHIPQRLGEVRYSLANIEKAEMFLDWKPTVFLEDWIASCNTQKV